MSEALEQRRNSMLDLISAHSEDTWCAGWMQGIEDEIRKTGGLWLVMAAACGGWPKGYRAQEGWEPLDKPELDEAYALIGVSLGV